MINNFSKFNFEKYKRVFALGCSFTGYRWPTWADIIGRSQCPGAEFFNLGRAGAGNPYIVTQLVQANNKFQFCETDLVMVMFTGFTREDRYINGNWVTPGNIFTQNFYPEDYVAKYSDPKGYAVRDIALMELAYTYLENLSADSLALLSVPPDFQSDDVADIIGLHGNFLRKMPTSLYDSVVYDPTRPGYWEYGAHYHDPGQPNVKLYGDYHPGPKKYYQYLVNLGVPLNSQAELYAEQADNILKNCSSLNEIQAQWPGYENFNRNII